MNNLILASGSPRRKELLENLRIPFTVSVSNIEEIIDAHLPPEDVVMSLAYQKAKNISNYNPNSYVIGADTIVISNGELLGKPQNRDDAFNTLTKLSGSKHQVLTGVALISPQLEKTFFESTEVTFWELTEQEITEYIDSGEPFDKAGSYGIQGLGALLVKELKGDYFSVVGLPVARTVRELKKIGYYPKITK
ncbi:MULTISPECIES: Maf family protein [Bacillaceae]|uniref:Maf family protein n=1 Tax=Bacillaceae TaxID=186817 RepID=UPI002A173B68|nr:Maf family protein [Cytobacillus sp. IB215316]MDX8359414.1 Maf family protein [Cytobacillus sp. IB215316]